MVKKNIGSDTINGEFSSTKKDSFSSFKIGRNAVAEQFIDRDASLQRVKDSITRNIDVFIRLRDK